MLYYDFAAAFQRGYGEKIPVFTQVARETPAVVHFIAEFGGAGVAVGRAGAAEVGEG